MKCCKYLYLQLCNWSQPCKHLKWLPQAECQLPFPQPGGKRAVAAPLQLLCTLQGWEDEICLLGFPPLIRSAGVSVCWNLCKEIDCVCCGGIRAAADWRYWGAALTLGWGSRNLLDRNCPVPNSQLKSRLAETGCHLCWVVNDECRMCSESSVQPWTSLSSLRAIGRAARTWANTECELPASLGMVSKSCQACGTPLYHVGFGAVKSNSPLENHLQSKSDFR